MINNREGFLVTDELSDVLRSFGKPSVNGVLKFQSEVLEVSLTIQKGRIIEVLDGEGQLFQEVIGRLCNVGVLGDDDDELLSSEVSDFASLHDAMVQRRGVDEHVLGRAVRAVSLDLLHAVRLLDEVNYSFQKRIIRRADNLQISIAVNNLLIEFVNAREVEQKFAQTYAEDLNSVYIFSLSHAIPSESEDLAAVLLQSSEGVSVGELVSRVLRSRVEVLEEVLEGIQQGFLEARIIVHETEKLNSDDESAPSCPVSENRAHSTRWQRLKQTSLDSLDSDMQAKLRLVFRVCFVACFCITIPMLYNELFNAIGDMAVK